MSSTTTKTLDDSITEIRGLINDADPDGYRYTQAFVLTKINTALRVVYSLRPDAFIGNFTLPVLSNNALVTYDETDLGLLPPTPWPIDDRLFFAPVVFYVVGMLDLSDDEFADDNRAMTVLQAFKKELTGT